MGIQISPLHVRRSILIQAPPAHVWQEFESFDRIAAWFGRGHELHRFDAKLGGQVEMSVGIDGERRHYGGPVLVFDREREVTFESNWHAPHAWPVPTFFTFRLTPLYDGTGVEIFHHGFDRLGADAADNLQGFEEGWDMKHLTALRSIVG
ncbi:MAG: SRPBCC domain-containing protein [Deltaproteobacteria bacterium]|nr:SRPBCC domain-containing protein [Deltaproteobacteria bacterium]MBW2416194.1 SRPBCC domain-containing protein [Deltaproteobacteria bacterium]